MSKSAPYRVRCLRGGFTLLETLIASAIAAVVLLILAQTTENSSKSLSESQRITSIDDYVQNLLVESSAQLSRPEDRSWSISPNDTMLDAQQFYLSSSPVFDYPATASVTTTPVTGIPGLYLINVALTYTLPVPRTYRASGVVRYES